ncbi:hypothetical protein V1520DRAFT_363255 [Lipomyces starkeyi]|uniref:Uncharacterized protein n=1 Tax=Lipomyces starkeyi NRRL Y-11557 TaxID=675824 RepID=A0A1E3Q0Y3_LIPST|nr:hypothetical protein LIPSTDRAFT_29337 [Lipomyces starkeyi NRRL Y-11557]
MLNDMAAADNEQASYERALNFLTANEPERRCDIRLSYISFQALEEQAQALYGHVKYPRVEYAASDSRVTIYTAPSAFHGASAASLQLGIRDSVRDVLIRINKEQLLTHTILVGESTYESVDEQRRRSIKTPDGGLKYYSDGCTVLTVIIEVGVSEGYRELQADIMLWMNEFHCRTAILLWNKERPRFRFPGNRGVYSVDERPLFSEAMQQVAGVSPFGPYRYRDKSWFGTLDTAFIEVYKRDSHTGNITTTTCPIVQNGQMVVQGDSVDIGLTLGDAFPVDEDAIRDSRTVPVHLQTDFLRNILISGAIDTAQNRFIHCLG